MAWPDFTYDVFEDCLDSSIAAGLAETDVGSILTVSSANQQLGGENTMEIVTDGTNPAYITYASVNANVVSVGFWYRTASSIANYGGGPYILRLYNTSYAGLLYLTDEKNAGTNARQIRCSFNSGPAIAGGAVTVSDGTWYWITLQFNRAGSVYWRVYNTSHNLVGSEQSAATTANYNVSTIYYGAFYLFTAGKYIYHKNFVCDKTDGTYPLYGWESAYTVTYDGNEKTGGTVPTDASSPYQQSAQVAVLGNTGSLVKTGFTFSHWNTAANGSGTSYDPDDTFSMPGSNVTLYAQWDTTYTVTYDGNENTGGTAPVDANSPYIEGATVTVEAAGDLVKTSNVFAGWNTAANGSGTAYAPAAEFEMPAANTTLYAQWSAEYTVTYDGNDETGGTAPTDASSPYFSGATVTVLGNTGSLAKTGYGFLGWNTAANGSGSSYIPGETFLMPAGNTTLYALWASGELMALNSKVVALQAAVAALPLLTDMEAIFTTLTDFMLALSVVIEYIIAIPNSASDISATIREDMKNDLYMQFGKILKKVQ